MNNITNISSAFQMIYNGPFQMPFVRSNPLIFAGLVTSFALAYLSCKGPSKRLAKPFALVVGCAGLAFPEVSSIALTLMAIYNYSRASNDKRPHHKAEPNPAPAPAKPSPKNWRLDRLNLNIAYGDVGVVFHQIKTDLAKSNPKPHIAIQVAANPTIPLGPWASGQAMGVVNLLGLQENLSIPSYSIGLTDVIHTKHSMGETEVSLLHIAAPDFRSDERLDKAQIKHTDDKAIENLIYTSTLSTLEKAKSQQAQAVILTPAGTSIFLGSRREAADPFDPYIQGLLRAVSAFRKSENETPLTICLNIYAPTGPYVSRFTEIASKFPEIATAPSEANRD